MTKCLVTKLNGICDNSELLKVGEYRVKNEILNPSENLMGFSIIVKNPATLEIFGDGYFTDENLATNKGKTINIEKFTNKNVYIAGSNNIQVSIPNKYDVVFLSGIQKNIGGVDTLSAPNIKLDLSELIFFKSIETISLYGGKQITGNISNLYNISPLVSVVLSHSSISGDISSLSGMKNLRSLEIVKTNVTGNLNSLDMLPALIYLNISYTNIIGDIRDLKKFTTLNRFIASNQTLTGDIATLPDSTFLFNNTLGINSNFTWSERPSSAKIISLSIDSPLNNVDKMLQDQANCQSNDASSVAKIIKVKGNRTSSSDDAIATLQSKGYTVSITPIS